MYREDTIERIEEIQFLLAAGKTRVEVAKEIGYSDVSCLYRFASKNSLKWNYDKKNYDAIGNDGRPIEAIKTPIDNPNGKESRIIQMFKDRMDGREIAKKLRFINYQALADHMQSKGYIWSNSKKNYIKESIKVKFEQEEVKTKDIEQNNVEPLNKYNAMLEMIYKNQDRLKEIFNLEEESSTIPRYILSGVVITKSLNIINTLDQLVREFSQEKNISQKQIVEVALIEFLRKYGYSNEVKANLKV